jgi:phage host-nuclease inhibitor protein Gam
MEEALSRLRVCTIELHAVQAQKEAELKALDKTYAFALDDARAGIAESFDLIKLWAEANPAEFTARGLRLTDGHLGWRTGQPQLKTLTGWTWDRVLARLVEMGSAVYVRVKNEVDKQTILNNRDLLGSELAQMGVKVVQEESFFVEPKLEEK